MISFKSIFSRIIFLHVIALVITAIVMPVVLYWFFKWAANDLHDQAMREQAQLVAHYLVLGADGGWRLDLPPALEDIYSQAVGRYAYAVVDDAGRVLFSSRKDRSPIFSADPRASNVTYLDTRHGNAAISGVSVATHRTAIRGRGGCGAAKRRKSGCDQSTTKLPRGSVVRDASCLETSKH